MAAKRSDDKAVASVRRTLTAAASLAASAMLARTVVNDILPNELRDFISSRVDVLRSRFSSELTIIIDELDGYSNNQVYEAATAYLATKIPPSARRLRVSKLHDAQSLAVALARGEEMVDVFDGVEFRWALICREVPRAGYDDGYGSSATTEVRSFELTFHKRHKDKALTEYLPYVLERSKAIKDQDRILKLHMNENDCWCPINLHHPTTFDTLAMDARLKRAVIDDLDRFVKRKDYYKRIGKAWKRGYLLYGPPGTGKSSLVGAMANHLKFDIYDLELSEVKYNSSLRRLLTALPSRSILVIEDIDCAIDLQNRDADVTSQSPHDDKITLSGLLNFVDGLWSSSGEERLIVFTTNYKDRLDPALLRPGRMDMHVHMGYCSPCAFRQLVSNYHAVNEHPLFREIEGLMGDIEVTPAEVAEELMRSDDTGVALEGLVELLKRKRKEAGELKAREESTEVQVSYDGSDDGEKNGIE